MLKPSLFLLSLAALSTRLPYAAAVTIYNQDGATAVSAGATQTGAASATATANWLSSLAAYNNVTLTPPALPSPMPSTAFSISVMNSAQDVNGLGIQQGGDFFGFSIEMSVVTQVSEYPDCAACVEQGGRRDLTDIASALGLGLGLGWGVQSARARTSFSETTWRLVVLTDVQGVRAGATP